MDASSGGFTKACKVVLILDFVCDGSDSVCNLHGSGSSLRIWGFGLSASWRGVWSEKMVLLLLGLLYLCLLMARQMVSEQYNERQVSLNKSRR